VPSFFPEGDAPLATDPSNKSLQKINSLLQAIETNTGGASGGGLTDAELRATPVPISGTVTANGGDFVGEQSDAVAPSKIVQIGWYDDNNGEFLRTSDNSRFPVGNGILESVVKTNGDATGNAVAVAFDDNGSAQIPSATNPLPISGTISSKVAGWDIPLHDYRALGYTSGNLTSVTYKTGGSGGTTVATLTLGYDGSGNLVSLTKT